MDLKRDMIAFANRITRATRSAESECREQLRYLMAQDPINWDAVKDVKAEMWKEQRRALLPQGHTEHTDSVNNAYIYIMSLLAALEDNGDSTMIGQLFTAFKRDYLRGETRGDTLYERAFRSKYYGDKP